MKRTLTFLVLIMVSVRVFAQSICDNHVIIALDGRCDLHYEWDYNSSMIEEKLPEMLGNYGIDSGIVSTMIYSLESYDNDFSKYTHIIDLADPYTLNNINEYWGKMSSIEDAGVKFSLLSIAKPYCLKAVKVGVNEKNARLAYRTFLILISDLKYNGNDDFHDELRHKPGMSGSVLNFVLSEVKIVQQNYFYDFITQVPLRRGYMMLFECIPQQRYFALESVVDYPHRLTAKRTKKGYSLSFEFTSYENPNYQLIKTEVSVGGQIFLIPEYGDVNVQIPARQWNGNDTIHVNLKSWVRLIDGIYNRTVLSPDGTELQGKEGLNNTIVVEREPDAKVLWVAPLPDFLFKISFWTSNQAVAAGVWSVVFILLIFAFIILLIGRTMKYNDNKGEYKIQ